MKFNKYSLTLIVVIAIAGGLRVVALMNSQSFWFDEVVSVEIAKKGIIDSWQYLKWENNPPLHYWFLHIWIKLFGQSEKIVRLSSLVMGVLNVVMIYFLGKKIFNKKTGLVASFLLAISSYQIYLARDARMYPLLIFLSIASYYFFWCIVNKKDFQPKIWLGYIIFTSLALYTHITALFLMATQNLYYLVRRLSPITTNLKIKRWIFSQGLIFLIFAPWLYFFITRSFATLNSGAWYFNTNGQGLLFLEIPRAFLFIGQKIAWLKPLEIIIIIILLFFSLFDFKKNNDSPKKMLRLNLTEATIFSWIIFLVPLFSGLVFNLWVVKYYLIGAIGFYLLLANGLIKILDYSKKMYILIPLILLISTPYVKAVNANSKQHQWNKLTRYVEKIEQAGDKILVSAFVYRLPFEYYYRGGLTVKGFEPRGLENNLLLKAVKYNWYPVLNKNNMPSIQVLTRGSERIIIVNPSLVESIYSANLVISWFVDNNWKLVEKKQFGGFIRPTVLIFERPNK